MDEGIYRDELLEFMQETIAADNYRDLAARILNATANRLGADIGTLWRAVIDGTNSKLILAATYRVDFLPLEKEITYEILPADTPNEKIRGLTAWIAIKKKPVIVSNPSDLNSPNKEWAGSHSGAWDKAQFWKGKTFGCLLGFPLTLDGNLLGVIKFERYLNSKPFSEKDKERAKRWLTMIALTLKGMISREEQERKRQEALRELSSKLLDPASVTYYEDIIKLAAEILNADISTLWLFDKKKRKLNMAAQYGLNPTTIKSAKGYDIPESVNVRDEDIKGLTAWTFFRNRPFYTHNWERLTEHPSHQGYWDKEQWQGNPQNEFGCLYAAPLLAEGKPIGVIKVEKRMKVGFQPFTEVERATFDLIAVLVSVAPPLKAVIRDKDALVLDYFHILRAPTANAITALETLREELKLGAGSRPHRIESRLNMLADNLSVAYTQALNAFFVATLPDKPAVPSWRNLKKEILQPSISMFTKLFPETKIIESADTQDFELKLTDFQVKKVNVVIHNLIDNAIAFSNKKPVSIDVSTDLDKNLLIISVVDSGIGISSDMIDKIWELGVTSRSDALTRPESRGQGLATVGRIIEEFGWKRSLRSEINIGTTMNIFITNDYWRKLS